MTPVNIVVLLHYHYATNDYNDGDYSTPSIRNAIDFLHREGLISTNMQNRTGEDPHYVITDRGQVYVEALRKVPLPVQAWVMPKGE